MLGRNFQETTQGEASTTAIDNTLYVTEAPNRLAERVEAYKQHVEAYKQLPHSHFVMEPVPDAANKQTNMAAGRKNRRALGDIENLITVRGVDGKAISQVSRRATRSFCAQLLANAQAAKNKNALAANAKGPIVADGLLPKKRAAVRLPVQKKAALDRNRRRLSKPVLILGKLPQKCCRKVGEKESSHSNCSPHCQKRISNL
ncbi:hypothetical protein OROHE_026273 [Orobanche hederae]